MAESYPTDTVWGIVCDTTNAVTVAKIYALKKKRRIKSMIVLMNGEKMMYNVFKDIPDVTWEIIDLSEKPKHILYYKTDTHWNKYAGHYGYTSILESINI